MIGADRGSPSQDSRSRFGGRLRRPLIALAVALLITLCPSEGIEGHLASQTENAGNTFSAAADFGAGP